MLAALVIAAALQSVPVNEAPPQRVPLSDLLGRTPEEVGRLTGAAGQVTAGEGIRIVEDGRSVVLYAAERFHRAWPEGGFCVTGFPELPLAGEAEANPRSALMRRSQGWFVFENGVLTGVHPLTPPPVPPQANRIGTRQSVEALMLSPKPPSPLTVAFGRLPLSDGVGVLNRLPGAQGGLSMTSLCSQFPPRGQGSDDLGTDIAWAMVGLTLLPFVPFQRAEESRADREGGALLDSVEPGSILPNGVEAFVARRRGVRVYRDPVDPDYAVIVVKLGNGADNTPDRGLLGLRANRVVWEIRREGGNNGLSPLMCRDAENRPGRVRQGCTAYGYLRP
jgi:hypothetical protein